MKKLCFSMSVILCLALMFTSIAAYADDGVLTLEAAKELALKNDVQYNSQERYIAQAKEDYDEVYADNTKSTTSKGSVADKSASDISQDIAIENAALNVTKAIFNKDDLRRSSDYEVTEAFYGVIKGEYSLRNAEAEMGLKKSALETAQVKYELGFTSKDSVSQAKLAYESSQAVYNNAISELQNSMSKLSISIGKDMDVSKDKLDKTLIVPDIKSLDINKIKEDNLKNNWSYYSLKEQYKLAQSKLLLIQDKYDYYYEKLKSNSTIREDFDDMVYEAQRDFDDAKYNQDKKLNDLDANLNTQYNDIKNLYENYENQKKEFEDAKLAIEESKVKYQMGLLSKSVIDSSTANLSKLENKLNTTIMSLNTQYMNMTQYSID
jgi:outer membrane protein TolC